MSLAVLFPLTSIDPVRTNRNRKRAINAGHKTTKIGEKTKQHSARSVSGCNKKNGVGHTSPVGTLPEITTTK
jgi:hypothetical protein